MRKSLLFAIMLLVGVVSASAQTIDDFFNEIKSGNTFSAMTLPKEQCKSQGFDALDLALSETVNDAALQSLKSSLARLPKEQQMTEVNKDGAYVAIYVQPLSGGKSKLLIVAVNGDKGSVIKGICDDKLIKEQLQGFHLNNIFGD